MTPRRARVSEEPLEPDPGNDVTKTAIAQSNEQSASLAKKPWTRPAAEAMPARFAEQNAGNGGDSFSCHS